MCREKALGNREGRKRVYGEKESLVADLGAIFGFRPGSGFMGS